MTDFWEGGQGWYELLRGGAQRVGLWVHIELTREPRNPGGVVDVLEHENLTGNIIGAAIEVHKTLGPGLLEAVYENALCVELRHREIPF